MLYERMIYKFRIFLLTVGNVGEEVIEKAALVMDEVALLATCAGRVLHR